MANQAKEFYEDYKAFFGDGTSPDTEQTITELQEALQALSDYVDTLPTEDTDTVFDPTPLNEAIAALQQGLQTNGELDETNVTSLQNALQSLQDYVNTLPTEDTDTIFDPTPLNESISILQTSLQQFREQMEIVQAQQAAALAENTQIDSEQQQAITALDSRVTDLENAPVQTKVIGYQDATAQEIIAFYEQNPHAALIVDNNGEQHTTLFFLKQSDSKCLIRYLGTINGVWHVFQHTVDNARWTSTVFPIQDKLESGTSIKTINGESLLGSGNIEIQITDNDTQADWNETDNTSPAFIQNKPTLFSGVYDDLTDKPALFSGSYNDLSDKPALFSGSYNDLTDKPALFSGSYNDLTDKPTIPDAQVQSDWNETDNTSPAFIQNKPALFSGSYKDLTDKPTLFSGAYDDLTGKPTLFSGSYNDLTDKPAFEVVTKKIPQLKLYSITLDDVVVPANGRLNTTALPIEQLTVQLEEGYKIRSYKSLMILKGTHASTGITDPDEKSKANNAWRKVFLQSFSTGGGETIPNVSVYNANDYDATVMLIMDFNTVKEEEITFLAPAQTPTDPTNGDDNG